MSRHICPLQLPVIARALSLWTRPNDIVHSPFMGIGSEGYEALRLNRRFIGAELKQSYFAQAVLNLHAASTHAQTDLFARTQLASVRGTGSPMPLADTEPAPPV